MTRTAISPRLAIRYLAHVAESIDQVDQAGRAEPSFSGLPRLVNVGYYAGGMSTTRMMILGLVQLDAAGARLRRAPRAGELERRRVGQRRSPGRSTTRCASSPRRGCCARSATEQVGAPAGPHHVRDHRRRARTSSRRCCAGYWWELAASRPTRSWRRFAFLPALPRGGGGRRRCATGRRLLRAGVEHARGALDQRSGCATTSRPTWAGCWSWRIGAARGRDRLVRAGRRAASSRECRTCRDVAIAGHATGVDDAVETSDRVIIKLD